MPISKHIIRYGLELAKGSIIYGEPIESLSKEELVAVAALGWKAFNDTLGENIRRAEFKRTL